MNLDGNRTELLLLSYDAPPGANTFRFNIAYNIVHKHYGDIQLDSRPGRTVFRVRLPTVLPVKG